jgi:hypothetical protein
MSDIQHADAHRLLRIIQQAIKDHSAPLDYRKAAEALGRDPATNSRTVAQICDLLDAAAALAGIPLLALVMVRELSGGVNRNAWMSKPDEEAHRDAIINTSRCYPFSPADFDAIDTALAQLAGKGNRAAWDYIRATIPSDELYRRLTDPHQNQPADAIDDIGADLPAREPTHGLTYVRDPRVRDAVRRRAAGKCELCGEPGFQTIAGERYIECHHVIALVNDGADRMSNVIGLCPNHHREAHFGARAADLEQQMICKLADIMAKELAAC